MVRTSRSSGATAAPESMDDIDLDVMFAADGDALFDGLDIDLDMDDIAGGAGAGGVSSSSGALDASNRSNTASSFNRRMVSRPPAQTQRPSSPDDENGEDELSRTRRKTKRKAKTPAFFEDDDDDYDETPSTKKKRKGNTSTKAAGAATATLSKKKAAAKITQDDVSMTVMKPPPSIPKAKGTSSKASSIGMPPPLARTGPWVPTSSSSNGAQHVAAAGQFGNRQKQRPSGTSFPSLPKPAVGAATSNQGGRIINKLPLSRSVSEANTKSKASTQPQHKRLVLQPESTYCGLQPSPTHFYPFMPALPTEPVLKSRKVYGSVDRIHTSLVGYLHTPPTTSSGIVQAKENEPLFLLLQEAFKEEKSGAASLRLESIGISIGELRQTITSMDKNRIASDWYGVCALIKRQHDFLKQNCDNMERWCRDNFSKEDFAEVYAPSKKRKESDGATNLSVLKTFTKREIKVKISFTGMKDPKMPACVHAVFPHLFLPNEVTPVDEADTKQTAHNKKKSQTASSTTSLQDVRTLELIPSSSKIKPPQPLSYANMKPPRRRRNVAEMITRTARELSKAHSLRIEMTRKSIDRREGEQEKLLSQDSTSGIHTAAMWKWVDLSGFFNDFTMQEVEDSLQDIRSITTSFNEDTRSIQSDQLQSSFFNSGEGVNGNENNGTVFDRLQSLLVDVQSRDDDENDCNTELEGLCSKNIDQVCTVTEFIDMSNFTLDERSCIVLQSFGFSGVHADEDIILPADHSNFFSRKICKDHDHKLVPNGKSGNQMTIGIESDDLDDLIEAMKSDLFSVEAQNDERVAYLELASLHYRRLKNDQVLQSEKEAGLITKCQQLLRKSKELKAKSGAAARKDDSLALPW